MKFTVEPCFENRKCYFAAANGYGGFRSYFHEFFRSEDYEHIYVLKGGPGTGKSRLMKTVGSVLEERGCRVEWIFCSSDPLSLDGIIAEEGGRQIAVLDGTAPHERDAVIPGAIDTLVNLGDGWDAAELAKQRSEILSLAALKTISYRKAYEFLSLCDKYDKKIAAEIEKKIKTDEICEALDKFIRSFSLTYKAPPCRRSVGAFGRFGKITLPTFEKRATTVYTFTADAPYREYLSDLFAARAARAGYFHLRAPSPFSDNKTDAVFFPEKNIAVLGYRPTSGCETHPVGIPDGLLPETDDTIRMYTDIKDDLLLRSQTEFSAAADAHAAMEKIYTAAMDFEKNNAVADRLVTECCRILFS